MWIAVCEDRAGVHADKALGDLQQDMNDVLDPYDRNFALAQGLDRLDQLRRLGIGQARADLIQQQHDRIGGDGARQFQTLAVQKAERLRSTVGNLQHAAKPQRVDAAIISLVTLKPSAVRRGDEKILENSHPAKRSRNLM